MSAPKEEQGVGEGWIREGKGDWGVNPGLLSIGFGAPNMSECVVTASTGGRLPAR